MFSSTVDYSMPHILVGMGLCRDMNCMMFNSHGPAGSTCPGNSKYFTRMSCHKFEAFETSEEQMMSNTVQHSETIGLCIGNTCYRVGYPGMICMQYIKYGVYDKLCYVAEQSEASVYVRYYLKDDEGRSCQMLKRISPIEEYSIFGENSSSELSLSSIGMVHTSCDTNIED